ncbi:putative hydrolase or acyltransferase of alpha/beta superfamily [Belliella baltica DSM 15883]|uniref:Putative hydrolase or acyltransferase of alpha/beta superfamily n=1 Tax=Belliella baltica (strain DSM 15883 / CIP 108006 / LMG 21964 / BA134) TaxID=866536 RepID=I3Z8U0_BELBD|nr:alpha/beta fold hydrolase [Belliella baltica]AFL85658.1 putative hydrolase or acyltransferase of alpha/beta superfamily [Belliella baltica DSM 15883]
MDFLNTSFGKLAYQKHGKGNDVYLLFHGFGQNMKAFDTFLTLRKETQTYLIFDIFYHGQSSWKSINYKLTKDIWKEIIIQLMLEEGFEKFHLIGYSMGGKFSLATYELFPKQVQSLLLMAPDGIKTGFWYNMATFPGILNRVFRHVVFHPERFFKTMKMLKKVGILQKSLIKFVKSQMKTRTMRAQVYFTWIVFKPLQPSLGKIIQSLRENQTPITLVTGKFDKMVTTENLKKFTTKIPHIKIVELESGHNSLIEDTKNYYFEKGF